MAFTEATMRSTNTTGRFAGEKNDHFWCVVVSESDKYEPNKNDIFSGIDRYTRIGIFNIDVGHFNKSFVTSHRKSDMVLPEIKTNKFNQIYLKWWDIYLPYSRMPWHHGTSTTIENKPIFSKINYLNKVENIPI